MSAIKTKVIESALLRKGFRRLNTHHEYFWLYVDGRQTFVQTKLSHGLSEYGDDLLAKMSKKLGISKKQLLALVSCSLEYEEYVAYLQQTGRINTGQALPPAST